MVRACIVLRKVLNARIYVAAMKGRRRLDTLSAVKFGRIELIERQLPDLKLTKGILMILLYYREWLK